MSAVNVVAPARAILAGQVLVSLLKHGKKKYVAHQCSTLRFILLKTHGVTKCCYKCATTARSCCPNSVLAPVKIFK